MNILLITTGGTICSLASSEKGNKNDIDTGGVLPELLGRVNSVLKADKSADDVSFETASPISTLSENMTTDMLSELIGYLQNVDYDRYDGVVILHGTDTLHITAPLLASLMKGLSCPVILVSGNRIITDPESNAFDNLSNAVRMIKKLKGYFDSCEKTGLEENVFTVYRNMDGVSFVHRAMELEECADYSEDFFSRGMIETSKWLAADDLEQYITADDITHIDGSDIDGSDVDVTYSEVTDNNKVPLVYRISCMKDNVLYIKPYVGINYDRYGLDGVSAVLHGLYHSSTANALMDTKQSALRMLDRCKEAGIPMYIFPCNKESYRYVTTKALLEGGAIPISGGTWNRAYTELLIRYAEYMSHE